MAPGGCPDHVAMLSLGAQSCGCFSRHTPLLPLPGQWAAPCITRCGPSAPPAGQSWWFLSQPESTFPRTLFWGSKITADGDCSHEIIRRLLLGRKAMTNLDGILKIRDITLLIKVCLVKAMVFPVVMCICESCTIKKAEGQRIAAFELWCWRRLLRVPWTARRYNQSILKEISPGCSLEGLMLKLKL